MRGIHRWPVISPHKGPVTRKMFPFDDVIMSSTNDDTVSLHIYVSLSINVLTIPYNGSRPLWAKCMMFYQILSHVYCMNKPLIATSVQVRRIAKCPERSKTDKHHGTGPRIISDKYSLLMHCIKIKSPAKFLLNEQYVFVGGNIYFICVLSCSSEEA